MYRKIKLCVISCVYQRPEITQIVFDYWKSIQEKTKNIFDFTNIIVDSDSSNLKYFEKSTNFKYYNYYNNPLSDKWNYAASLLKNEDFDYVLFIGSDDIMDEVVLKNYYNEMISGIDFIGLIDMYVFDYITSKSFYWKGYSEKSGRFGETIGLGRCLSKNLITELNYTPWAYGFDRGLDGTMQKKLKSIINIKKTSLVLKSIGGIACDIKSTKNITNILSYKGDLEDSNKDFSFLKENNLSDLESNPNKQKLIIISTFWNAGKLVSKCINSIKNQSYVDFICYLVDDVSTDNSYELAKETIGNDNRFILIKNETKKFKVKNFIDVIRNNSKINYNDVIIELDGDDELSDNSVLEKISKVFSDKNIWMCGTKWKDNYGRISKYGKPNADRPRSLPWSYSQMRTYRAFLFRQIKDEHLKMNGEYFKGACDIGYGLPMLEMSGNEHFYYIDEPLYIYNWHSYQSYSENGAIGDKVTQSKTAKYIYSLPRYEKLTLVEEPTPISEVTFIESKDKERLNKLVSKEKKPIDYEKINSILNKNNKPKQTQPPQKQNKPINRQEIIDIRKDSNVNQIKKDKLTRKKEGYIPPKIF